MEENFKQYIVRKKVEFVNKILETNLLEKCWVNFLEFMFNTKFGYFLFLLFLSTILNIIAILVYFRDSSLIVMTFGSGITVFFLTTISKSNKNKKWFKYD